MKIFSKKFNINYPIIILIFGIISIISKLVLNKFGNGFSYGFNYNLFQPDGINYFYLSNRFLGKSELESAQQAFHFYTQNGYEMHYSNFDELIPRNNPTWGSVRLRILYPMLSAPFVYLFGGWGMIFIPAISYLLTIILCLKILLIKNSKLHSFLVVLISIVFSPTVNRWMLVNYTDSLLILILTVVAYLLICKPKLFTLSTILVLILLSVITKFSFPYWFAIAIYLFTLRRRILGILTFVISCFATYLTLPPKLSIYVLPTHDLSNLQKFIYFPFTAIKVIVFEFFEMIVLDKFLFTLLILSLIGALLRWREKENRLLLLIFLAAVVTGGINGVLGVNFRYQLPIIGFALATINISRIKELLIRLLEDKRR